MSKSLFIFRGFLSYLLHARHHRGFGVHSPFAFDMITNVMEEKYSYYCYRTMEEKRKSLLCDKTKILVKDFGTGPSNVRRICDIARVSLKSKRYAQLLFRLAVVAHPINIIELGTSLGLTTSYLASSDKRTPLYSFEGCPHTMSVARQTIKDCGVSENVHLILGNIDEKLPETLGSLDKIGFVFFDANHTKKATLSYYEMCVKKAYSETVFVFDDIHSSQEMEEAWLKIKMDKRVCVTFDIYTMGLVYFNPDLQKQDYTYLFF